MKCLFKSFLFIIISIQILCSTNAVLLEKNIFADEQIRGLYALENESVDILFVGSSRIYAGINPCYIWDNYGITSYDLSGGGLAIWSSYAYLVEALKTQSPSIVVCDIAMVARDDKKFESTAIRNLISLKPSINKLRAIRDMEFSSPIDKMGIFLGLPYYHTRYKTLEKKDFLINSWETYNGFKYNENTIQKEDLVAINRLDANEANSILPISNKAEAFLNKIINLCAEKNINLVFVNAPYIASESKELEIYNYVSDFSRKNGILYLDGNKCWKSIGLDIAEDFYNEQHLNYSGSLKYTEFIMENLSKQFHLQPGEYSDQIIKHWENVSMMLRNRELFSKELKETKNIQ